MRSFTFVVAVALTLAGAAPASADMWTFFGYGSASRSVSPADVASIEASARSGSAAGEYNLGYLYQIGRGLPRDYAESARWYRRAADQGHGMAQYRLGDCYALGRGVPTSLRTAYFWLNLSAARNIPAAAIYRDNLSGALSRSEIARIQRETRLWRPVVRMP